MEYKPSQDCNPVMKTWSFLNQSGKIDCFRKYLKKGGESAIKYIRIFQNAKALEILVGNSYSEDQLMYIFLDNFQQDGKYSSQIASH